MSTTLPGRRRLLVGIVKEKNTGDASDGQERCMACALGYHAGAAGELLPAVMHMAQSARPLESLLGARGGVN